MRESVAKSLFIAICLSASVSSQLTGFSSIEQIPALDQSLCTSNFGNSSFNVGPLRANALYRVSDSQNNNNFTVGYTFFFNICDNTGYIPYLECNITYPGIGQRVPALSGPSPAFQYNNQPNSGEDQCHRLGSTVSATTLSWGLYDTTNPAKGVFLQYLGGDVCPGTGKARTLRIWLLCYNDANNIPDQEIILESDSCYYEIFVNSAYGCPAECPTVKDPSTGNAFLCANHGVCDFDAAINKPRCFCNEGFTGDDCTVSTTLPGGFSMVTGVLLFVSLLLVATLAFLGFLWFKIKGLRLDPTAYSALRSGPEDDGISGGAVPPE